MLWEKKAEIPYQTARCQRYQGYCLNISICLARLRCAHNLWKLTFLELPVDPARNILLDSLSGVHGHGPSSLETYIDLNLSAIGVLDSRVIALDPFIMDKLGCPQALVTGA